MSSQPSIFNRNIQSSQERTSVTYWGQETNNIDSFSIIKFNNNNYLFKIRTCDQRSLDFACSALQRQHFSLDNSYEPYVVCFYVYDPPEAEISQVVLRFINAIEALEGLGRMISENITIREDFTQTLQGAGILPLAPSPHV